MAATEAEIRGQDVFTNGRCAICHTVTGTTAAGSVGPDLTHFGGRATLAAATLPNTRGHVGGWIAVALFLANMMRSEECHPHERRAVRSGS